MRAVAFCLVLLAGALFAVTAEAATATGSIAVSMTIQATCSVQSASALSFGSTTALTSSVATTSSVSVQCSSGAPYNIGLSAGSGSGSTVASRLMTSSSNATISYSIYQDAGHTTVWGNTVGTNTVAATGTGGAQSYTAFGLVSSQTTPAVGSYSDTVTVTITY